MATCFTRWAGPTSAAALAVWSGLGKRVAKAGLQAVSATAEAVETAEAVRWLPGFDNLAHLRASPAVLADTAHHHVQVGIFGRDGIASLAEAKNLFERTLTVDGTVVGLWAWDPSQHGVVLRWFGVPPAASVVEAVQAQAADAAELLRRLGHGRLFSLDNDNKLMKRLERVLAAG